MKGNPIEYKKNIKSQWGEDGIIEEIFKRIIPKNKICIEVGSWDGEHLSNTWNLWHEYNWSSILIEGDKEKFLELINNTKDFNHVTCINSYVTSKGKNSLDKLLDNLDVPTDFDLLSIDIDGNDYYVFKNLVQYKPRVVIIEFNPTVPPSIDLVQVEGEYFGASALALLKLARDKEYSLVCCTETNLFFVLDSDYSKLFIEKPNLSEIFPDKNLTYVITAQDGRTVLNRKPTYLNLKKTPVNLMKIISKKFEKKIKLIGEETINVEIHEL